ncbi:hypothetical protein ABMA28_016437 [Loxostege sticticalis]|uniref:Uncharacterized protein n=1 Tax=Loxostege sticticalis TaxID=481309 RepID=A0ABD0T950_LOXSC
MELVSVRVKVDNPDAPPAVYLDEEYHVVTIRYRPKQNSSSTYVVTAKTIPIKDCNENSGDWDKLEQAKKEHEHEHEEEEEPEEEEPEEEEPEEEEYEEEDPEEEESEEETSEE